MPTPTSTLSPASPRRRWVILALVALAQLTIVLDLTVVNIALPSAQRALGFSDGDRQWIVTAYALAFGSLLPLGGRVGDMIGRKRTFVTGLIGFAGISAVGGLAQSFVWLLAARALQGMFAALLAPAALAVLSTTFTEARERNRAFGIFGAIVGSGAAVGLLLGGVLTQYLSWRWCLYVNVVLAVPAVIGSLALLEGRDSTTRARLDMPGALTASGGLLALVYGFSHAQTAGWTAPATLATLTASVVILALFVLTQRRSRHPLLPLQVLADRNRGGSYLAILIVGIGMFGVFLFLTYYLQQTLGYSPVTNGLAFLPMIGAVMVTSTGATGVLLARTGPRPLVVGGMVYLTRLGLHASYAGDILPSLLLVGAGIGLVMAPAMNGSTAGVDPGHSGIASALANTSQQVGGSIGTALLNTLATSATASYLAARGLTAHGSTAAHGAAVAAHGSAAAHAAAAAAHARAVRTLIVLATVHGYTVTFWVSAGIFAFGALVCGAVLGGKLPQRAPGQEPVHLPA